MSPLRAPEMPPQAVDLQSDREKFDEFIKNEYTDADIQRLERIAQGGGDATESQSDPQQPELQPLAQPEPLLQPETPSVDPEKIRKLSETASKVIERPVANDAKQEEPETTPPPTEPEPAPEPVPSDAIPELTLGIVDRSKDAENAAGRAKDVRISRETTQGNMAKRIWQTFLKRGFVNEYFRQKYAGEEEQKILEHQDVYRHENVSDEQRDRANQALVERHTIRGKEGEAYLSAKNEKREELDKDSELHEQLRGLVTDALTFEGDSNQIRLNVLVRFNKILSDHREADGKELLGEGAVTASNILDIVATLQGAQLHEDSLKHAIDNMVIYTSESRTGGQASEAHRSTTDKFIAWSEKRRPTSWIPATVLSGAVTGVAIAAKAGRGTAMKAVAVTAGISGVGGFILGAAREWKRAGDDIAQTEAEFEMGNVFVEDTTTERNKFQQFMYNLAVNRRERLEKLMYKTPKFATELKDNLRSGIEAFNAGSEGALKQLLDAVGEQHVLHGIAEGMKKPMIRYNGAINEDRERIDMIDARRDAHLLLKQNIDAVRAELELADDSTFDQVLEAAGAPTEEKVLEDIKETDKARRNYKLRRAAGMGGLRAFAMSAGITGGVDILTDIVHSGAGSFAPMVDQGHGFFINGGYTATEHSAAYPGEQPYLHVSSGDGKTSVDVLLNQDGTLPQKSQDLLTDKYHFSVSSHEAPGGGSDKQVTFNEYIASHPEKGRSFDSVTLETNSPNEQGGHLTANPDGSIQWWSAMNPNAQQFDVAIANPDGTHTHLIYEPGQAIDPEVAKAYFYQKSDGNWGIRGDNNYMAWGDVNGNNFSVKASIKADEFLAQPTITEHAAGGTRTIYEINTTHPEGDYLTIGVVAEPGRAGLLPNEKPAEEEEQQDPTEQPSLGEPTTTPDRGDITPKPREDESDQAENPRPMPPPEKREPGAKPAPREKPASAESRQDTGDTTADNRRMQPIERDRIPELRDSPGARVELGRALQWYGNVLATHNKDYAEKINDIIDDDPSLTNFGVGTRAVMTLPVRATQNDGDRVYEELAELAASAKEGGATPHILIHSAWMENDRADPDKNETIQNTLDKIQQAITDFPELRISNITTMWSQEQIEAARKGRRRLRSVDDVFEALTTEKANDVAMAAVSTAIKNGVPNVSSDILLMNHKLGTHYARRYFSDMVEALETHPEKDTFTGSVRTVFGRRELQPNEAFLNDLRRYADIFSRKKGVRESRDLFAENVATRMSTLAAVGASGFIHPKSYESTAIERIARARNPQPRQSAPPAGVAWVQTADEAEADYNEREKRDDFNFHVVGARITRSAGDKDEDGDTEAPKGGRTLRPDEMFSVTENTASDIINKSSAMAFRRALALLLPVGRVRDEYGPTAKTYKMYELEDQKDGTKKFRFTPEGREWFMKQYGSGEVPSLSRSDGGSLEDKLLKLRLSNAAEGADGGRASRWQRKKGGRR